MIIDHLPNKCLGSSKRARGAGSIGVAENGVKKIDQAYSKTLFVVVSQYQFVFGFLSENIS